MNFNLRPSDPFTGFLSLPEADAINVIKSQIVATTLSGQDATGIMKKIAVQLFIRRVLVRGDTRTIVPLIDLGYKPTTAEDIWLIKDSMLLTDMFAEKYPDLAEILRRPLNRHSIIHQMQVKDYLHDLGWTGTKISEPTDFRPDPGLMQQFQNLFKNLFS